MADATQQVIDLYGGGVTLVPGGITVRDQAKVRSPATDRLVWQAVFGTGDEREAARWLLWELGQLTGARPASINDLYLARGRGECGGFTVPAMNVRMLAYDTARAIFRAARAAKAGAIILEIARSEIAYTEQRPAEYVSVIIAAALREGYSLPLFIQGDHCQVNQKKYQADPGSEIGEVKKLIAEEVGAGFYNIDVDTSTLVDLSHESLEEQQRLNYEHAAEITAFIREQEPEGVTVSVGADSGRPSLQGRLAGDRPLLSCSLASTSTPNPGGSAAIRAMPARRLVTLSYGGYEARQSACRKFSSCSRGTRSWRRSSSPDGRSRRILPPARRS